MKTFRFASIIFSLLLMSACEVAPAPESRSIASLGQAPSRWNPSKFPLNLAISSEFNSDEKQAIRDMALAWSDSVNAKVDFMDTLAETNELKSSNLLSYEDSIIGVYKLTKWPTEGNGSTKGLPVSALAVTQIFGMRKNAGTPNEYIEIQHADILINYEMYGFSAGHEFGFDLQTVVLHEMGHLLGLYHDESSPSLTVMYPSITRHIYNRQPNKRDQISLKKLYNLSETSSQAAPYGAKAASASWPDESSEGERVMLRYELRADGCVHHH